jgi:imidazole glycerol phosphate synthase subunit HisF
MPRASWPRPSLKGGLEAAQYNVALKQVKAIAQVAQGQGSQTIVVPADAVDAFGKAFQMLRGRS